MADLSIDDVLALVAADTLATQAAYRPATFPSTSIGGNGAVAPASSYVDPLDGATGPVNNVG